MPAEMPPIAIMKVTCKRSECPHGLCKLKKMQEKSANHVLFVLGIGGESTDAYMALQMERLSTVMLLIEQFFKKRQYRDRKPLPTFQQSNEPGIMF